MPLSIPNEADAGVADQAELHSRDIDALVLGYAGTGVISGCAVTAQGSPDTTVAVAAGSIATAGSHVAVTAGNVTMTAADGTNPRLDLVYVTSAGVKTWLAGTAGTNPTPPAIPAGGVPLAFVYVPANDNLVNTAQIVDKRVIVRERGTGYLVVAASNSAALIRAQADYICTGATDQTTINTALTDAGILTTVWLAAGNYATTAAITPTTGQTLLMDHQAVITRSGTGNAIEVIGTSGTHKTDIVIEGGRLFGPSVVGTQVAGSGVLTDYCDRVAIRGVYAKGFGSGGNDAGVQLLRSTEVEVSNCELTGSKNGFCSGQPADTATNVERCRIINNVAYANYDDGIHGQRSKYMTYVGNICWSNPAGGAADGSGIDLLGDEYDTVTGNICFLNNRGIEVGNTADGTYPDIGHIISGNTCAGNTSYGFSIIGRVIDCAWVGNNCKGNTTDGFRVGTATSTLNVQDVLICENSINDNGTSGVDVFGYATHVDVRGNHISGHSTADVRVRTSTGTPTDYVVAWNHLQSTTKISDTVGTGWTFPNYGQSTNIAIGAVNFIIDGSGATITTGIKGDIEFPFDCTLTGWTLLADQSGSITLDLWKDTYANYPAVVGDTITASDKPLITTATKAQDFAPTGWTVAVTAGQSIRVNVDSAATVTRVSFVLYYRRT